MTSKEFYARTGVTEGYAAEILKDEAYAKWRMPSGAAFVNETPAAEPVTVDEDLEETTAPVTEQAPKAEPTPEVEPVEEETETEVEPEETEEEGGSVEVE